MKYLIEGNGNKLFVWQEGKRVSVEDLKGKTFKVIDVRYEELLIEVQDENTEIKEALDNLIDTPMR
jgi:hypothetical protein